MSPKFSAQGVQVPAGQVHVLRGTRSIQLRQLAAQTGRVRGLDTGLGALPEEGLQALVTEGPDHEMKCIAMRYTQSSLNVRFWIAAMSYLG